MFFSFWPPVSEEGHWKKHSEVRQRETHASPVFCCSISTSGLIMLWHPLRNWIPPSFLLTAWQFPAGVRWLKTLKQKKKKTYPDVAHINTTTQVLGVVVSSPNYANMSLFSWHLNFSEQWNTFLQGCFIKFKSSIILVSEVICDFKFPSNSPSQENCRINYGYLFLDHIRCYLGKQNAFITSAMKVCVQTSNPTSYSSLLPLYHQVH